ncbi:LptF/LptG family permease [Flavobacterium sp.]|uniref:LptF/LptG family permease n=1 Tax=Flavobacterium sp. TaxID=239 RepID=UPI002C0F7A39|nr:LptF/LptG family permease [Flavobacterium sp.]HSD07133.1 LptF/LptG family permease [Flavobacterium sp.]
MKILDKYLLKTFLGTFATVFVILFFVFILQTVWLFIAELAGKDLDFMMVVKFLAFSMPRIVPLVLPLSILLASIMSFGNLSEHYEFAAMKSSGISLQRAMRSLTIAITILSFIAFLFANNVIPYAEFKFINFRKNIAQAKPALAITEGQFSDVGTYNIKVNKKSGENGNHLTGITIHQKSVNGDGSKTVIRATNGELVSNENTNLLQLILNDGNYYQDIVPKNYQDKEKLPFAKSYFKKYRINIDLSQLNKVDTKDESVSNTNNMLNVNDLKYTLDSLEKNRNADIISFSESSATRFATLTQNNTPTPIKKKPLLKNLLSVYNNKEKSTILNAASSSIQTTLYNIDATKTELDNKKKNINSHILSMYDKFVIVYACFLMFFIGAPLGAIIRKGGIGLPIVFAVLIFISFHFINTFGKRISQEDGMAPFFGAWMSSIILTPLALLLTYRATNDIGLINMDVIITPVQKAFQKIFQKIIPSQNKE